MRKPLVIAAIAVTLLATATVAVASIPDSQGVIHGCRDLKSGSLRVIDTDAGQTCDSKGEAALSWSQAGPAGPAGANGVSGYEQVTTHLDCTTPQPQAGPCNRYADLTATCPA